MMNWEETVIDTIPIIDKWLSGELESRHVAPAIAESQAKATWEAREPEIEQARLEGIREVVEWIQSHRLVEPDPDSISMFAPYYHIEQAQLEEWRIE